LVIIDEHIGNYRRTHSFVIIDGYIWW